ncbi:thiol:disulfide interchange protein DsbD [Anseongella ginsenosidimutans]|uniref:Thiol:disulfide interchange protein DsbD n=1 Tax=Anseongella ginsenosidimutans TaxID=496056 RepID=A0A4R3KP95_9SPHI|nr:cytochrome c biogenesis protein CcdA [Anseongella ginsenosidimutans]QEC52567.1 disulfide bond formation protein DsbD [Anseongella ginsenosidimutans]TCS86482.1 thiol:disulfide interchange protein DsbD [Anseongella ginsenosidimutans]
MKKFVLVLLLLACGGLSFAQIYDPVQWRITAEEITKEQASVTITAEIEPGWHLYSQFIPEGGPQATTFQFEKSPDYELAGTTAEKPDAVASYDPNFDMEISWHTVKVRFVQQVRLKKPEAMVKGTVEYMVCNDTACLPPEIVPFTLKIDASAPGGSASGSFERPGGTSGAAFNARTAEGGTAGALASAGTSGAAGPASPGPAPAAGKSFWGIFLAGLLGGFAAFLMPCIYPMIPLTASFFTRQSGSRSKGIRNALIYGLSIIVIYVGLGLAVTLIFGASALNAAASSAIFNLVFFGIILLFAISFLGGFEITLPSRFVNKVDARSHQRNLTGIFFMAFTLSLVSFSCTGPIIGLLLVEAVAKGSLMGPAAGMLGFSAALAIPFVLFAIFPAFLKELPKSGSWLNTVKVSLGFIELALAMKFLSNVDLAYHWGILDREVFLAIWIVIFGLLGLFLLGKLKLFSENPETLSLPRLLFAALALSFTIYMVPGMWGAPLKAISAWLPPQPTQDFDLHRTGPAAADDAQVSGKKYGGIFHAPHGLDAFYDYEEGLAHARKVNKPVLIDFTGWSCVNCRKMEASVWSDPAVLSRLKNDYVLVSLYVDDKTALAEGEQYTSSFSGKKITRIGQKWSDLQASTFGTNAQPHYVIADHEGAPLVPPRGFDLDISNYVDFLETGIEAFKR